MNSEELLQYYEDNQEFVDEYRQYIYKQIAFCYIESIEKMPMRKLKMKIAFFNKE